MKKKANHKITIPPLRVDEKVSLEEQIAQRAYELWQHGGHRCGDDLSDWLRAETEVNEWHHQRMRNSI